MEKPNIEKTVNLKLNKIVFFPPWLALAAMVAVSLTNEAAFLAGLNAVTNWILSNFTWAFNLTTVACVATVIIVYFSPLAKVRIGGRKARPIMSYINLVWITLHDDRCWNPLLGLRRADVSSVCAGSLRGC